MIMSQEISTTKLQELEEGLLHHMDRLLQRAESLALRIETFRRVDYVDTILVLNYLHARLEETLGEFNGLDAELKRLREIMQGMTSASERGALQQAVDDVFIDNLRTRYELSIIDYSI